MTSYFVDTLDDVVAMDGMVSLREAIQAANSNVAVNEASAGQDGAIIPDTITFAPSLANSTINLSLGELIVSDSLAINTDQAENLVLDGGGTSRVFNVASATGIVILDGITITGGMADLGGGVYSGAGNTLRLNNVSLIENVATGDDAIDGGGGIYLDGGSLEMTGGSVLMNQAVGASGSGGGIFSNNAFVSISDVLLQANVANRAGGAIEQTGSDAVLILDSVTMESNIAGPPGTAAPGNGGGLHISGSGDAEIIGSIITNNAAASEGGGLWNGLGRMTVSGTTVEHNVASGSAADNGGGGIFNNGGTLNIRGGEIAANIADGSAGSGGGVFSTAGRVSIEDTVIESNVARRAGGGIEIIVGDVFLSNVMLGTVGSGNIAGPEGSAAPGNGGGLHVTGDGGATLTSVVIVGGMVQGNTAASEGGGLWNQAGARMTISGKTRIGGNRARGESNTEGGGGIFNNGGSLLISGAHITNNATTGAMGGGGGIANDGGFVSVANAIIAGNFAAGSSGSGGGVLNINGGQVAITDSELTGNIASRAGGAIEDASDMSGLLAIDLQRVVLNDNNAGVISDDATASSPGNGGGLHVTGASDIRVSDSIVVANVAASEGGGLWNGSGTMTVLNTTFQRNMAAGDEADNGGGALFNNLGTLIVSDSQISMNLATGASGSGGGIFNFGGSLSISDSMVSENSANRAGGGIEQAGVASTTLTNVTLSENIAGPVASASPGNGGGLHVSGGGDVMIFGGSVVDNIAALEGGGLWNGAGTMTIDGTSITGNVASGDGADDGGGGIFNNGGDLVVTNTTIVGNVADGASGSGGGLLSLGGMLDITDSSFEFNGANRAGGGIEIVDGTLVMTASNLINNDVDGTATGGMAMPGNGGGLHVSGTADITIDGGVVFGNVAAAEGGGLWNQVGSTLTIQNGTRIEANTALGDPSDQGGGGVFNNGGTVVIEDAEIVGNFADGASGSGGGLLNVAGGIVMISNTLIEGNVASRAGGGIEEASTVDGSIPASTSLTLNNVILRGNNAGVLDDGMGGGSLFSSPGNGGGLHVSGGGDVMIFGGSVVDNIAALEGGGLWNGAGTMTIDGTSITGNVASGDGADDGGGGIFNNGGDLVVTNTTIVGNVADGASGSGGGILNFGGDVELSSTELRGNVANRAGGGFEQAGDNAFFDFSNVIFASNVAGPSGSAAPGSGGGIHISNSGDGTISNSNFSMNIAARDGGGIWNGTGTLIVRETEISENMAMGDQPGQGGGGLYNLGTLTISESQILDNTATTGLGNGGGILNAVFATTVIADSQVRGNEAARAGGGIENIGNLILNFSELSDNSAGINGGGLHISDLGIAILSNSAVTENSANREGGGLWNSNGGLISLQGTSVVGNTAEDGGGVFNDGTRGDLRIINSTISGNTATRGGGLRAEGGSVLITSATIAFNEAMLGGGLDIVSGNAIVSSSIVGANVAPTGPDINGAVASEDFNVVGNTQDATIMDVGMNDVLDVDPRLEPLADNGGPTMTHALMATSPAIGNGDPNGIPVDQRGVSRPQGNGVDSGSFESALSRAASSFSNLRNSRDVNQSGLVTPVDALIVINMLNRSNLASQSMDELVAEGEFDAAAGVMPDVNGDGRLSPLDALSVINYLNRDFNETDGQAESTNQPPLASPLEPGQDLYEERRQMIDEELLQALADAIAARSAE